jgi:hypothetical protein
MKPEIILEQINKSIQEINELIGRIYSNKHSLNNLDIDLLNLKIIELYEYTTKLKALNILLPDFGLATETVESKSESLGKAKDQGPRFIMDFDEVETTTEIVEEKIIPVEEPIEKVEEINIEEGIKDEEVSPEEQIITKEETSEELLIEKVEINEPSGDSLPHITATVEDNTYIFKQQKEAEIEEDKTSDLSTEEKTEEIKEEEVEIEKTAGEIPVITEPIFSTPVQDEKPSWLDQEPEKKSVLETFSKPDLSINEALSSNKENILSEIQKGQFSDIKSAISLNLKITFIKDLFGGNERDYKRMIDFLNKCQNYSEARMYIQEEKDKRPEWDKKQDLIDHLMELINRKFT